MRSFRNFTTRWPISALIIAVFLGPIITAILPTPAVAQAGTMEVAVVAFRNTSSTPDPMYAKLATDAVAVELVRSGKFSVTADDALDTKLVELGFKGQEDQASNILLSDANLQRLGQEVGATSVITGEVTSIKVDQKKKKAEVLVAVRMLDVASREWVNGAAANGVSHSRVSYNGEKDTDWIIEAINDAGRKAVEMMVSYIIPEATVLGTFGTDEVLLNRGSQDGLEKGMEMIVLRRGETGLDEVVGRVKVSTLSDTDAHAKVTYAPRGVKPQDHVRAVFKLPEVKANGQAETPRASSDKRITKSKTLLWSLVALVGVAAFMKGGNGRSESVPDAIVAAGVGSDAGNEWGDGGIMVLWNSPKDVRTQDILEYHVWRDNKGSYPGNGTNVVGIGPVWTTDEYTGLPISGPLGSFDHHTVLDTVGWAGLGYSYPSEDHSSAIAAGGSEITGNTVGKTHKFWLSCIYRRYSAQASAYTFWETVPVYCGQATVLDRPESIAPGGTVTSETVALSDITFRWRGSMSADQYVIEMCPYPDFRRDATWVKQYFQPTSNSNETFTKSVYYDVAHDPDGLRAWVADMQKIGKLTEADPVVYWRVGARCSRDVPGPYPSGDQYAQKDGAKNTRYIYSDPNLLFSFNTDDDVPPLPE
ncbi:MAG: hypothetical protein ACYC27_08905 [Armatimonadota bacterium]